MRGDLPLYGQVTVPGAKNSVLPIMAASLLCAQRVVLENVPQLSDVACAARILQSLGCRVLAGERALAILPAQVPASEVPPSLMRRMRSSLFFLAPLLARTGRASITAPGGCDLGARPIDMHLAGLAAMGANVEEDGAQLTVTAPQGLRGAHIALRFPSVGATETLLMAACCARGQTVLDGCAVEPEVVDLARFLSCAGACITGAGTRRMRIRGRPLLQGARFRICPDRIFTATLLCAVAGCGGSVTLRGARAQDCAALLRALRRAGCEVARHEDAVSLRRTGALHAPGALVTDVYPALPTDAAPLLAAAMLRAEGATLITDTIFERRFACAQGFAAMRAACGVQGRTICVQGVPRLAGAQVCAPDLRGGAALVLAALQAEGESIIAGAAHIARGYEDLAGTLASLGADAGYVRRAQRPLFENAPCAT